MSSCVNEYFLTSGCTLPLIVPLLWLFVTILCIIIYFVYGNKKHTFGGVFILYSLSCAFITSPMSVFIRQLAYIVETEAGYFRYFVIFMVLSSLLLSLVVPYYFIGIHLGFVSIITIAMFLRKNELVQVEDDDDEESIPFAEEEEDYIEYEDALAEKIVREDKQAQLEEEIRQYTTLMYYSKYALLVDWFMFVIYSIVYYLEKPYGTYIVFMLAVLPRFIIFVLDLCYSTRNTLEKVKLGLYILSDILIALFYVIPVRYLIYVADILDGEEEEDSSVEKPPLYKTSWLWKRVVFFGVFIYLLLLSIYFFKAVVLISYAIISLIAYVWYYQKLQKDLKQVDEDESQRQKDAKTPVEDFSGQIKWELKWEFAIKLFFECIVSFAVLLPLHFTNHGIYVSLVLFIQSFPGVWYLFKDHHTGERQKDDLEFSDKIYNGVETFWMWYVMLLGFGLAGFGLWLGEVYFFEIERRVSNFFSNFL